MKLKNILTSVTASALAVSFAVSAIPASAKVWPAPGSASLYGDANLDGEVNIQDCVALNQLLDSEPRHPNDTRYLNYLLSQQGMANADVFNPGSGVTYKDLEAIQKYVAGEISSLPVYSDYVFVDGEDNWSFRNHPDIFGDKYNLLKKYKDKLYSGLNNAEKENVKTILSGEWGGSCYGMAVTSLLSFYGVFSPSAGQSGAVNLHDIIVTPNSKEVISLVNYYFAVQATDYITQLASNAACYSAPKSLLALTQALADGSPSLVCYYPYSGYGHAVVAYGIEYGEYEYNNTTYDARILIYDNNMDSLDDRSCIYFTTDMNSWYIPYRNLSNQNGVIGLCTSDLNVLNYHGYIEYGDTTTAATASYAEPWTSILTSAPIDTDYELSKVKNSNMSNRIIDNTSSNEDDIYEFSTLAGDDTGDINFGLKDADKGYVMDLDENAPVDLDMRYENDLIHVDSQSAGSVLFDSYGYAEISGDDSDYNISIVSNDEVCVTDWYKVGISGKASSVKFMKSGEGYIVEGEDLTDVTVSASNDDISVSAEFSTDLNKAFIYEIDENTIGIAVDTDNDGTFETTLNAD